MNHGDKDLKVCHSIKIQGEGRLELHRSATGCDTTRAAGVKTVTVGLLEGESAAVTSNTESF